LVVLVLCQLLLLLLLLLQPPERRCRRGWRLLDSRSTLPTMCSSLHAVLLDCANLSARACSCVHPFLRRLHSIRQLAIPCRVRAPELVR
jgi:hypothetical protein